MAAQKAERFARETLAAFVQFMQFIFLALKDHLCI